MPVLGGEPPPRWPATELSAATRSEHIEEQLRRARLLPLEWAYSRLGSALRELECSRHRRADFSIAGGELEHNDNLAVE